MCLCTHVFLVLSVCVYVCVFVGVCVYVCVCVCVSVNARHLYPCVFASLWPPVQLQCISSIPMGKLESCMSKKVTAFKHSFRGRGAVGISDLLTLFQIKLSQVHDART